MEAVLVYLRLPGDHVVHVDPTAVERVCSDPDDDIFVAASVEGAATHLITGNLGHFPAGSYRGIQIVNPATFLSRSGIFED